MVKNWAFLVTGVINAKCVVRRIAYVNFFFFRGENKKFPKNDPLYNLYTIFFTWLILLNIFC